MVEVISSLEPDGRTIPYDFAWGWVTSKPKPTTSSTASRNTTLIPIQRPLFTLYKRWRLIGLEVGMSVESVALRREATGVARGWNADVVATAGAFVPGDELDGEGGDNLGRALACGHFHRSAAATLGLRTTWSCSPLRKGQTLSSDDVAMDRRRRPSQFDAR